MSRRTVVPLKPYEYPPVDPHRIEVDGEFVAFRRGHQIVSVFRDDLAELFRTLWEQLTDKEIESVDMDIIGEAEARWSEGIEEGSFIELVKRAGQAKASEPTVVNQDGDRIVFDEGDGYLFAVPIEEFATPISVLKALSRMAQGNLLTMKHVEQLSAVIGDSHLSGGTPELS